MTGPIQPLSVDPYAAQLALVQRHTHTSSTSTAEAFAKSTNRRWGAGITLGVPVPAARVARGTGNSAPISRHGSPVTTANSRPPEQLTSGKDKEADISDRIAGVTTPCDRGDKAVPRANSTPRLQVITETATTLRAAAHEVIVAIDGGHRDPETVEADRAARQQDRAAALADRADRAGAAALLLPTARPGAW